MVLSITYKPQILKNVYETGVPQGEVPLAAEGMQILPFKNSYGMVV